MRYVIALLLCAAALAAVAGAQETAGLSLVTVQSLTSDQISATGRMQARVSARIGPRLTGHLMEFGKDEQGRMLDVGMSVKAGQLLFKIDDTTFRSALVLSEAAVASAQASLANLVARTREEQLEQLRQDLAELDVRLADKEKDLQRFRRLVEEDKTMPVRRLEEVQVELAAQRARRAAAAARLKEGEAGPTPTQIAVAEAAVKQAQASLSIAQKDLKDTAILAPFDGMITQRFKSPGDYLTSGPPTDVIELVAVEQLEAEIRVPEAYLANIEPGKTQVTLRSPLLRGGLALPVTRVVSAIDAASGTFTVRVVVPPGQRGGLVPGAFLTATVGLGSQAASVIVPQRAVQEIDGKTSVLVAEGGKMVRREVTLGDRLTEGVIVTAGLSAGQQVLLGPAEQLKDGAALPAYLKADK